jgi:hypothetical protein
LPQGQKHLHKLTPRPPQLWKIRKELNHFKFYFTNLHFIHIHGWTSMKYHSWILMDEHSWTKLNLWMKCDKWMDEQFHDISKSNKAIQKDIISNFILCMQHIVHTYELNYIQTMQKLKCWPIYYKSLKIVSSSSPCLTTSNWCKL